VLLFMVLISLVPALTPLYLYVSTFRSMCAVPNMTVFCTYYYYYYYYYYYLLQLDFHSVAVVFTVVTKKNKYT